MAARGSCPAPTRRLLVLLLLPLLLWAPVGVRAGPDEDLSHRNQEPPAPAQQLQPQPAAVQGLEPARAEVRAAAGGDGAGAPSEPAAGYQAPPRRRRPLSEAAGGGEPAPASLAGRRVTDSFPGRGLASPGCLGEGKGRAQPGVPIGPLDPP